MVEMKRFEGPGFNMQIPTNWLISSTPAYQAMFFAPREDDDTQANMTVSIRKLEEGGSLLEVVNVARAKQVEEYPQFQVLEEVDYTEKGGTGYKQKYRWHNEDAKQDVVQTQAFFMFDQFIFSLTGTTFLQHAEKYDPIIEDMIKSFRIRASTPN
jgi:hypothetical protein